LKFRINENDSLIVVDVQRDFCPGGALPVPDCNQIILTLNKYIAAFDSVRAEIFATRDWHPPNHVSFKPYGGPWPPHCVQRSKGAEFHPNLKLPRRAKLVSKATSPSIESYSGFDGTDLEQELRNKNVKRVFIGGLATDYCVKNTVLDALNLGFEAVLLTDATRGIDRRPGDTQNAIQEMIEHGAKTTVLSKVSP
jgi:nicotinamidase/pyrazinamidase